MKRTIATTVAAIAAAIATVSSAAPAAAHEPSVRVNFTCVETQDTPNEWQPRAMEGFHCTPSKTNIPTPGNSPRGIYWTGYVKNDQTGEVRYCPSGGSAYWEKFPGVFNIRGGNCFPTDVTW